MKTKMKSVWQWLKDIFKRLWLWMKTPPTLSPRRNLLLTSGLLLMAIIGMTALCLMIGTLDFSRGRFSSYFHEPTILLLNFLPVFLLIAFTYFATNRAWLAYLLPSIVLLVMAFVNYFKVTLRGDPFVAYDFYEVGEAAGILGQYTIVLPIWFFISLALLIVGALVLLRYARFRIPKKRWWIRVLALVLCIAFGYGTWSVYYTDNNLYVRQKNYSLFNEWKDAENHASHGFLYSFLHSINAVLQPPPEGYSEQKALEILSTYPDADIPAEERVNIVVTMLESFSDLSVFDEIPFVADPYAEYHALLEECYHGSLIADTIGGATINAERAFLTGFTYPQPQYSITTNSFVHYLSEQGYQTDGSHPGHDWFYSRNIINDRLGFDRYLFMEGYYENLTDEEHAADSIFFSELAKIYDEETADGEPYFSFSVSYQNHSPYDSENMTGTEYVSQEGLSDEAYCVINNYLNGVADTGKQIAAYVDSFRDNSEPVILLFYGDHKPTFGTGNCYYEQMGINAQERSMEGCKNLYTTPYFIWANDAAKELLELDFSAQGNTISPAFLMAELFEFCGWEGPAWMQYQRQVRSTISVFHRDRIFMVDGSLTDILTPEAQAVYDEFAIVQYYERTTLHVSKE